MKNMLMQRTVSLFRSRLIKNSFWGIAANGLQSVLLSLFFVIVARKYTTNTKIAAAVKTTISDFI